MVRLWNVEVTRKIQIHDFFIREVILQLALKEKFIFLFDLKGENTILSIEGIQYEMTAKRLFCLYVWLTNILHTLVFLLSISYF